MTSVALFLRLLTKGYCHSSFPFSGFREKIRSPLRLMTCSTPSIVAATGEQYPTGSLISALISWGGSIIFDHTQRHQAADDNAIGEAEIESQSATADPAG